MSLGEVGGSGMLASVPSFFSSKKRMVRVRRDLRVGAKNIEDEE